jgi:RNA polymerase sigma-70 factor (ECF subfamily)
MERLMETYRPYLRLLARLELGAAVQGKADASDLVQETLLRAFQGFDQFRGETEKELTAWLRRILAHQLTDLLRRFQAGARQVGRERSLGEVLDRSSAVAGNWLAASTASPSRVAADRETAVVLAEALADLSADHQEVILLHSLQELGWEEVARSMGRTPGAVRLLWLRAIKELRPRLEACV